MPTYELVYGDDEQVVRQTLEKVVVEREDGWVVFFRGKDVILRVQEAHVRSLELVQQGGALPRREDAGERPIVFGTRAMRTWAPQE